MTGGVVNLLVESGRKSLEATAKLADDLRLRDARDEEPMPGSGASHIQEVSHLPLRPAVHSVRLTRTPSFKNVNLLGTSLV